MTFTKIMFTLPALMLSFSNAYCGSMGPADQALSLLPKESLYFGAGIGGSFDGNQFKEKNVITGNTLRRNVNNNQLIGDLFVGYGYTMANTYYIGAEVGTNFPSRTATINSHRGVTIPLYLFSETLHTTNYITLDLLPGYRIQPEWLVYGRIGASLSNLSFNQYPYGATHTPLFKNSDTQLAGRFGLGATYALTQHVSASLDYYYTSYQTTSVDWALYSENFTRTSYANFLGASITYTV